MGPDHSVIAQWDPVPTLTFNRPRAGNSLCADMVETLHDLLDEFASSGRPILVIRGEGRHFCTGFDLSEIDRASDGDLLARFVRVEELLARIWCAPFATIAIGQGCIFGAGADLFAACTYRVAVGDASFRFPGAAFGLVLGTRRLAVRIGEAQTLRLVASGRNVDAKWALEHGLATAHIEQDDVTCDVEEELAIADLLAPETYRAVRDASGAPASSDSDLANLVRSASRPGLRDRIVAYRDANLRRRVAG